MAFECVPCSYVLMQVLVVACRVPYLPLCGQSMVCRWVDIGSLAAHSTEVSRQLTARGTVAPTRGPRYARPCVIVRAMLCAQPHNDYKREHVSGRMGVCLMSSAVCPFMITGELVQRWRVAQGAVLERWPRKDLEQWGPVFLFSLFAGILVWEEVSAQHCALPQRVPAQPQQGTATEGQRCWRRATVDST